VPPVGVLAVVRFVSELVLLGGLAFVGWQLETTTLVSLSLAVLLPVLAAAVWGMLVAPRATRRLDDPWRLGVEIVLFAAAAVGLVWVGSWWVAVLLLALYVVGTPYGRAGG
jgi:hypothetical protein